MLKKGGERSIYTEIVRVSISSATIEITFLNTGSPYQPTIYSKDAMSRHIEKSALTYLM